MADRFVGLNRGETENKIVEGAATAGKDIEVRVDTGKGFYNSEIIQQLEKLINYFSTRSKNFK